MQHLLVEDGVHAGRRRVLTKQDRLPLHPAVYPFLHHLRRRLQMDFQDCLRISPGLEQPGY